MANFPVRTGKEENEENLISKNQSKPLSHRSWDGHWHWSRLIFLSFQVHLFKLTFTFCVWFFQEAKVKIELGITLISIIFTPIFTVFNYIYSSWLVKAEVHLGFDIDPLFSYLWKRRKGKGNFFKSSFPSLVIIATCVCICICTCTIYDFYNYKLI